MDEPIFLFSKSIPGVYAHSKRSLATVKTSKAVFSIENGILIVCGLSKFSSIKCGIVGLICDKASSSFLVNGSYTVFKLQYQAKVTAQILSKTSDLLFNFKTNWTCRTEAR